MSCDGDDVEATRESLPMSNKRASALIMIMSSCKRGGNEPFWGAGGGRMATSCTVMK